MPASPQAPRQPHPPTHEGRAETSEPLNLIDHVSLWISRVTMFLVVIIVAAIAYEVVLRYFFRAPTLWANELSLWLGGMSYLFAGLYAMQQRNHIRITVLYDVLPPKAKIACDAVSTLCIVAFAVAVCAGGFPSAWRSLSTWEKFGTAWNPPIPATIKPLILVVTALIALQAVNNFIKELRYGPPERAGPAFVE